MEISPMIVTHCNCPVDNAFAKKLETLDLEAIAYQLIDSTDEEPWTYEQAQQAIAQYHQFLYLTYLYPDFPLVPTEAIDRVWHAHILHTAQYEQDCQILFGYFLHHFPYFGVRGEDDRNQWQWAVARTQALFQEHFGAGTIGSDAMGRSADCQPIRQIDSQSLLQIAALPRPQVALE